MGNAPFTKREQLLIDTAVREAQRRANRAEARAESSAADTAAGLVEDVAAVPTGLIGWWGSDTPPEGWLLCDGAEVSRTTYAALFAIIAEIYGVGDGVDTFNLPDLQGRVVVGLDAGQTEFDALAETGGAKTVTLDLTMIPAHTHTYNSPDASTADLVSTPLSDQVIRSRTPGTATGSAGGGAAHNNLQPYLVLNGIIKT